MASEMKRFQVVETGKGIRKSYLMIMTESEMSAKLKALNEFNGYIQGLGGDRSYSAVAWTVKEDGCGWIDLDGIWKLYSLKTA